MRGTEFLSGMAVFITGDETENAVNIFLAPACVKWASSHFKTLFVQFCVSSLWRLVKSSAI